MTEPTKKAKPKAFLVQASDLQLACELGLLRDDVIVDTHRDNEQYTLWLTTSSSILDVSCMGLRKLFKPNGRILREEVASSYTREREQYQDQRRKCQYGCKKLNGQQYIDHESSSDDIECPFIVNVYGNEGTLKATKANFCHNHIMHIGFASRPKVEDSIARPQKDKRNRTWQISPTSEMIERGMLPAHNESTATLTGEAVDKFLLAKRIKISRCAISRIKVSIEDRLRGDKLQIYQKLESYFALMADKNPGTLWRFEKEESGIFRRVCVIPSASIHMVPRIKRLFGLDGAHLKSDMHKMSVYLVATGKDHNNHIIPIGFALVQVENYDNWCWFLNVIKESLGGL